MAESLITPQVVDLDGEKQDLEAANVDGNYFACSGNELFVLDNGSASPVTVTFDSKKLIYGTDVNKAVVVPAGETWFIGRFPKERFDAGDGVHVSYSAVTSITVGVFRITTGLE